ncbi:MAG: rRNA maturation RNase YbeY [Paracoccaceae bacterium]
MSALEPAEPIVELVLEDPRWSEAVPDLDAVAERAAELAFSETGRTAGGWRIALLACSDARITGLNAQFRGRDAATNVLSWPAFAPPIPEPGPGGPPLHLGDLALALETTRNEAEAAAIPLKAHAVHLILHGCLHLLGYDHETEVDAAVMEGVETRALARLGLDDPYSRGDAATPHSD